jgi:hypothetical protein
MVNTNKVENRQYFQKENWHFPCYNGLFGLRQSGVSHVLEHHVRLGDKALRNEALARSATPGARWKSAGIISSGKKLLCFAVYLG